jgi:hypothetical protein
VPLGATLREEATRQVPIPPTALQVSTEEPPSNAKTSTHNLNRDFSRLGGVL